MGRFFERLWGPMSGDKGKTQKNQASQSQVRQGAAAQDGRAVRQDEPWEGSHAEQPHHIPFGGWKDILRRVMTKLDRNNASLVAAGIAFYGLLSLFPLLIALVSIYSLFVEPVEVEAQVTAMSGFIPKQAKEVIAGQLHEMVQNSSTVLGWSTAVSILAALWSANRGSLAMMEGFNIAYGEEERRGFIKKNATALALTLSAVVFLIVALSMIAVIPPLLNFLQLDEATAIAVAWGRWAVLAAVVLLGLAILNRYAPSRNDARWSWVSVGSVASTLLLLVVSAGFSFYVSHFGSYNETYGSIGGVIVLLLWLYWSSYSVLVGAELNAEAELQTLRDTTQGAEKPMGARGAVKADHIPGDKNANGKSASRAERRDEKSGDPKRAV